MLEAGLHHSPDTGQDVTPTPTRDAVAAQHNPETKEKLAAAHCGGLISERVSW
jgi:hypothetical protein